MRISTPWSLTKHPSGDVLAEAFRHLDAALLVRVREDHGELVASEACDQVDLAELRLEAAGQVEQDPVADPVAVAVVDLVEVVQVEHHEHEGVAEAVGALAFVGQPVLEDPVAGDAGEGVDRGGVDELRGLSGSLLSRGEGHREEHGRRGQQDDLGHREGR